MSASKIFLLALLALASTFSSAQITGDDGPLVELEENLGWLRGKTKQTIGNMGKDPKTYYSFRNIPYAHSVSGSVNRYKQGTKQTEQLGTRDAPYDATVTGPLCFQGGSSSADYNAFFATPISDALTGIVDEILAGAGIDNAPGFAVDVVVQYLIDLLEVLLDLDDDALSDDASFNDLFEILFGVTLTTSEECLHLSVSTPYDTTDGLDANTDLLPVMFFVHGGGFTSGYGEWAKDLSRLGEGEREVVLVAINYRVGPFGFTCLNHEDAAGNMGMLDMVEALKWVQTHIAKFGGDPDKVTIFGESAGSASIGHLVLSPTTDGLFAQGIGQSGSALSPWAFDMDPIYHARVIAGYAGCSGPQYDDVDVLLTCLKALAPEELDSAYSEYVKDEELVARLGFDGSNPCAQTAGTERFYDAENGDTPEKLLVEGNYRELPIFFGANSREGSYVYGEIYNGFVLPNDLENDPDFLTYEMTETMLRAVHITQGYALRDQVDDYYFRDGQMGNLELMTPGLVDMMGAFFIKASSYAMVEYNSERANSFWYSMEHASQKSFYYLLMLGGLPKYVTDPGVSHADELMYMWDVRVPLFLCDLPPMIDALVNQMAECELDLECLAQRDNALMTNYYECLTGTLTEEEQVWSDRIVRAWTNFAATGNPTTSVSATDLPELMPWNRTAPNYIVFDRDGARIESDYATQYDSFVVETYGAETVGGDDSSDGGSGAGNAALSLLLVPAALVMRLF